MVFALAAATDYVDGPLARRAGPPRAFGTVLDNVADVAFVLAGTSVAAAHGLVTWAAPAAIAAAATAYLVASVARSRGQRRPARAYSAIGHAAGVCNYALVGLAAGSRAVAWSGWDATLATGAAVVVALNSAAAAQRWLPVPRARAWRASGTPGR